MKRFFTLIALLLILGSAKADDCCCYLRQERSRSDNIPVSHLFNVDDDYMTGYVQALIDMNYYEFRVRVLVINRTAYLFCLPRNALVAHSIFCYVSDVPCIDCVQTISGSFEDFCCSCPPEVVESIRCSSSYASLCSPPCSKCTIRGVWLPQSTLLFYPLIADPRQVMNSAALRFNDDAIGRHVGAVSFGDDFIFFRWKDAMWWHGDMDFGIQAGIFSVFDLDHPEECLVNTDFFVAAMTTYAIHRWSFRFRLWHMSSHLGDEFMLGNPHFCRCNLSDEGVDAFASFQYSPALRIYGGLGYIFDRDESFPEEPFYFEAGTEIRAFGGRDCFNRLYIQPFLAMHFRCWEEHNYNLDQTYALGVEWSKIQGVGRKVRLWLEYHNGYSKEGQFARERVDYFGIKMNYGF